MLRKASVRHVVLASALAGSIGCSLAQAQTPPKAAASSKGSLAVNTLTENRGFFALSAVSGSNSGELAPVVNAPLSAVARREEVSTLLDGNRIVRSSSVKMYRDSQGRTRTEHTFPLLRGASISESPSIAQIQDPVSGERFSLNIAHKVVTTFGDLHTANPVLQAPVPVPAMRPDLHLPQLSFAIARLDSPNVSKESSLGEKTMEGVRVVGTRLEYTLAANSVGNEKPITLVTEQWFSPDLGTVILRTVRSPAGIESTYKLEQLVREEPDRALFVIPPDFTKQEVRQRVYESGMFQGESLSPK